MDKIQILENVLPTENIQPIKSAQPTYEKAFNF